jgi:hypothetical protein
VVLPVCTLGIANTMMLATGVNGANGNVGHEADQRDEGKRNRPIRRALARVLLASLECPSAALEFKNDATGVTEVVLIVGTRQWVRIPRQNIIKLAHTNG